MLDFHSFLSCTLKLYVLHEVLIHDKLYHINQNEEHYEIIVILHPLLLLFYHLQILQLGIYQLQMFSFNLLCWAIVFVYFLYKIILGILIILHLFQYHTNYFIVFFFCFDSTIISSKDMFPIMEEIISPFNYLEEIISPFNYLEEIYFYEILKFILVIAF